MATRKPREADPGTQVAALESLLRSDAPIPRGAVVRGEERWYRARAVSAFASCAAARGLDLARHDAQDPDFDEAGLLADLSAPPMFSAGRLLLVQNAGRLLKRDEGAESPFHKAALAFLRDRSVPGLLAIEAESLRADHPLVKAVAALGGPVLSCRRLWETPPPWDPDPRKAEVVQWVLARAREIRATLDAEEAVYLVAATGNDLFALENALETLRRRGGKSVREVVGWTSGASPFQLAEDLCRGDAPRALPAIEVLFRVGFQEKDGSRESNPGAVLSVLFGSLRGKLRQSLAGARALERGASIAEAAGEADVKNYPQALSEFEARLRSRPAQDWAAMIEDLAAVERKTRTDAAVDASTIAALALRWNRARARAARPGR